jgi:hypothetical protein
VSRKLKLRSGFFLPEGGLLNIFSQARGLLGIGWDVQGTHAGIIFLDKLVERNPEAMVVYSGKEADSCSRNDVKLIFSSDSPKRAISAFALFNDVRPDMFDGLFPFMGLISEGRGGYLCFNFCGTEK